jgi:hypothetical protein
VTHDELIEKMCIVYRDHCPRGYSSDAMSAVLDMVRNEVFEPVTDWEQGNFVKMAEQSGNWVHVDSLNQVLASRRARLTKQKTERQTLETTSHLVRDHQTLCGLSEWSAGNVHLEFGVKRGVTNCVTCLRNYASELLDQPEHKTPEERVTVEEVHTTSLNYSADCAFTVMVDGKPTGPLYSKREYTETYRLGLIQQLKETK